MNIDLPDKLYTSTQVADILGVSLRTLYRYMEDNRIKSMRTASGRHRFTRDQILEFLNVGQDTTKLQPEPEPQSHQPQQQQSVQPQPVFAGVAGFSQQNVPVRPAFEEAQDEEEDFIVEQPVQQSPPQEETENVAADQNFRQGFVAQSQPGQQAQKSSTIVSTEEQYTEPEGKNIRYYRSEYSDLIELAKKVKESANAKDLEYAFTLYAGLSLHFLIKPFTTLHFYVNPEDMQIWKDQLKLTPQPKEDESNVGLIVNTDIVFVPNKDIGGFKVVDDKVLLKDLSETGEQDLLRQFRQHLSSQ